MQAQADGNPDHYGIDYPTDEERVEDVLVENRNRCFYSGKTTWSHLLRLPFRYAPLLEGCPENIEGRPAVPSRVGRLQVVVSHTEWQNRPLSEGALTEPMQRAAGGVYQLPDEVVERADGFPAATTEFTRS